MCRGRGAVVFCPGGRLVFQRSWGGSESEEPAERNLASVSCHRWLLSESARMSVWNLSRGRIIEAHNYASSLDALKRFEEAKALLGKVMPVARRILGDCHELTLKMRWNYANAVREDDCATRDELREANDTLEDTARIARRVLGPSHPNVVGENSIHRSLELVQAKLALLDGY